MNEERQNREIQSSPLGWEARLSGPADQILRVRGEAAGLSAAIEILYAEQKRDWKELQVSLQAFEKVRLREIRVQGRPVTLQYNPARLVNATAPVSDLAVVSRPCFLCPENMPEGQRAFGFGDSLAVVCNPFPIFRSHLVILSKEHRPQSIPGQLGCMLDFSLWSGFSCLYNGPHSGASAPDHFHFQAGPVGSMPVEAEALAIAPGLSGVFQRPGLPQRIYLLGQSRRELIERFEYLCATIMELTNNDEPELNLALVPRMGALPAVAVHPRGKHRPDCYYREGAERLLVSPGACDMSGLLILPRLEDFERLTGEILEEIYREVCLPEETYRELVRRLGAVSLPQG